MRTCGLLVLLLGGCVVTPDPDATPAAEFPPELAVALGTTLQQQHAEYDPPGMVAAVVMPDGVVWVGAIGDADLSGTPLLGSESFKVASVTKTFVAGLVMTLVDDSTLSLDDTIDGWIDEHPRAADITVRQLLNHSAGVPEFSTTRGFQEAGVAQWTDAGLVALVADADLSFPPGSAYAYSNTHYVLLSMIVEAATSTPWQTALATRVLSPLRLDDTRATDANEGWGDVVRGYLGELDLTDSILPSGIGGAGNVVSTAENLARWGRGLWGAGLLSEASTEALWTDPMVAAPTAGYGLGTLVLDGDDGLQLAHNGALNGYVSWVGYRPDLDIGVAVLANAWLPGNPPGVGYTRPVSEALWADVFAWAAD